MSLFKAKSNLYAAALSLLLWPPLASAQSGHTTAAHSSHSAEHERGTVSAARLLVADGEHHQLKVFDPVAGRYIASFDTVGRMSGLEVGPNGHYAYGIHRDDHRVTVVDSGLLLVGHGDHSDLQTRRPHVVGTLNVGQGPTHFTQAGSLVGFFNDVSGSVSLLPEDLIGLSNDMNVIEVAQPEHGAPVVLGDYLLSGGLSTARVDAYRLSDGAKVGSYSGCAALHGAARLNHTAYFGCKDGVLALEWHGDHAHARTIPNPPRSPEGARVGMIAAHPGSPLVYGNFGKGLSFWKPGGQTMQLTALGGQARDMEWSEDGQQLFVLTDDGQLHRLQAATGKVERSGPVIAPFQGGEKTAARPDFARIGDAIWVSSPATGELTEVDAKSLHVVRRHRVGGQPSHLAVSELRGMQH